MITPFMWLWRDPVGPAIFVALVGIATVALVYYVTTRLIDKKAGVIASLLYALSTLVVIYSRSSWNPNPLPFVSLLTLYTVYSAIERDKWWKYLFVGVLLGIALQLQYLALFLASVIFVYVLLGNILKEKALSIVALVRKYLLIFGGFLIGWSPFLAFEVLHNFPNLKTLSQFLLGKYEQSIPVHTTPFGQVSEVFFRLFARLVLDFPNVKMFEVFEMPELHIFYLVSLVFGIICVLAAFKLKNIQALALLLIWLVVGVALFGVYKKEIYDYYLGFMFPLPFILVGNLIYQLIQSKKRVVVAVGGVLFAVLVGINVYWHPLRIPPNGQRNQAKMIAEFVLSKTNNKPFNFALITGGNSDHAYRYFFELYNRAPVTIENTTIDPKRKSVTDQLLVVCEYPDCQPLGNSLWEVAGFGRAEVVGKWDISVVKVYKLKHYSCKN